MADLANFEAAAEEWENVQEIIPTFSNDLAQHDEDSVPEEFKESLLVTIEEFISDFRYLILDLSKKIYVFSRKMNFQRKN